MNNKIKQYAACFLALNLAAEPLMGVSLFRPQAIMAQNQDVTTEVDEPYLISSNKKVITSSVTGGGIGDKAIDGNNQTRWESGYGLGDQGTNQIQEWIQIDLGRESDVTKVYLNWEGAHANKYQIQVSHDAQKWDTIQDVTDGKAGEISFDYTGIKARYIRVYCTEKAMVAYGVSLWEFQVYGFNGLYKTNLALNKKTTASSLLNEWWMFDQEGNIKPSESPEANNATDGNPATRWRSGSDSAGFQKNTGQWLCVDLEKIYKIGEVNITWDGEAAASVYDIQVSIDGNNWTTVYRNLQGNSRKQKIDLTATCRYVRLFCRTKLRGNHVAVKEIEVFRQMEDETDVFNDVKDLPEKEVISVPNSKATYDSNDIYFADQARYPEYIEDELRGKPLASNDWWQSLVIKEMGNALSVLPLKVKYDTNKGLGMLTYGKTVWNKADDYTQGACTATKSESKMAFYVKPSDYDDSKVYNKVSGYGDYHVSANLYDKNGLVMANTFVKGSPYTYFDFNKKKDIEVNIGEDITATYFNETGNILLNDGDKLTSDHLGIKIVDGAKINYYCFNLPEGTVVTKSDDGLKIKIKADQTYMSVGTMTKAEQLDKFYRHGYAFVTDTTVTYNFDEKTSKITSNYNLTTKVKREEFTDQSYQCLMPHQWDKYSSTQDLTVLNITYDSPRGSMRLYDGNSFAMTDTFYGLVPEFTMPSNDEYSEAEILKRLKQLDEGTEGNLIGGDAYWQGKSLHPLGLGVLVADQIGNEEYRDSYLAKIKTILTDWLTYSGDDDEAFFFYDKNWGTLYYKYSEFGANRDISDHHFTYGYVVFACSILATYDDEFYEDYKEMIDLIVRDYASPYEDDDMFCKFRSFDPYEGHSWAGGYADNDDGNNQEAGSESLFGWVGAYLWATRREDKKMRDAAIYGFTTELNGIEHYWFNYYKDVKDGFDHSGWAEDWPSQIIGQTYGSSYFYGTFFGGYPTYVYGIHWCPVAEYISYYGMEPEKAANLYKGVEVDTEGQKAAHPEVKDYPDTDNSWQHIFYPFLSLSDPDRAFEKLMNDDKHSENEGFNTYWFINNMKDLGKRTSDIYATGGVSSSVYEKEVNGKKEYTAMVWNPTKHDINVDFVNSNGAKVGNALIKADSFLRLDPTQKDAIQVSKPEFSVESEVYDDTQYVKISCDTKDAEIHYTLDGSVPNENSPVYDGRIVVSNDTTIRAVALKDDYIASQMVSINVALETNCITTGTNLAIDKKVFASSENGNKASNVTDHNAKTRWEAMQKEDQWIYVDLEKEYDVNKVKLSWETAYAQDYEIQVSNNPDNPSSWKTVFHETNGDGKFDEHIFEPTKGRYVRIKCNVPGSDYTYSLYEIGVYQARQISKPELSLKSGEYEGNQFLSMASATRGVEFRYTTDGSEPTMNSKLYIPGLTLYQDTNIKVKAFKKGMIASETVAGKYVIKNGTNPGNVDNYDKAPSFSVPSEAEIEEELLAGESGTTDSNDLVVGNLAYGKNVVVSSSENDNTKMNIVDGNGDSVWSSNFGESIEDPDKEWCYIDLGANVDFNQVKIHWVDVTAPGNTYAIQVSDDGITWKDVFVYSQDSDNGEDSTDICDFDVVNARYVKMQGIKRGKGYGYAIKELEVRNVDEPQPFGRNVAINSMVTGEIVNSDLIHDENNYASVTINDKQSYQLDLAKTYTIDRIVLNHENDNNGTYSIKYSVDGVTWKDLKIIDNITKNDDLTFDEVKAKYIKVEYSLNTPLNLQEIEVYTVGSSTTVESEKTVYQAIDAVASTETGDKALNVIDDDNGSRWQANGDDQNEWIYINLGEAKDINQVSFNWEGAYAKNYKIQVSNDAKQWEDVSIVDDGTIGKKEISFDLVKAQYVRMYCVERGTDWGCSLYDFKAIYVAPVALDHILVGPAVNKICLKEKLQLQYAFYPANATDQTITFKSEDDTIASVDEKGLVTAKKLGETKITAMSNGKTSTVTVKVTGKLSKPTNVKATNVDGTINLTWNKVDLVNYYDVYVATKSDGEYIKVNETPIMETNYTVDNLTEGKYYFKVIARSADNQNDYLDSDFSRVSNYVKVANETASIELTETSGTVGVGQILTVPAIIKPAGTKVIWSSDNEDVATVDNGVVTGLLPGKATITIVVGDTTRQYYVTVTDKLKVPEVTSFIEDKQLTLQWNGVTGASSYEVYRKINDGDFVSVANSGNTTYTDNLSVGKYQYKVVARGDNEVYLDSSDSNIVDVVITEQLSKVKKPAVQVNENNVILTWQAVENATGYKVLRENAAGQFDEIAIVNSQTEYTDHNLSVGTYKYQVIALGNELYLESNPSETVGITVDKLSLKAVEPEIMVSGNKITLTWQTVAHATGYEVFKKINDSEYISLGVMTNLTYQELLEPGKYTYKIIAKGDGLYADSSDSKEVSAKITQQLETVVQPTASVTENNVTLTWQTVENASSYNVLRKNNVGQFEVIGSVNSRLNGAVGVMKIAAGQISYVDRNLKPGTYEYQVVAVGNEYYIESIPSQSVTVDVTRLSLDAVQPEIKLDGKDALLNWQAVANASEYEIFVKVNDGEYQSLGTTTNTTYTDKGLEPAKYSYKVKALGDELYADAPDSKEVSVIITEQLKTVGKPTIKIDENNVKLSWQAVENATGYKVLRKAENGEVTEIVVETGLEYIDTNLVAGVYEYQVVAIGNDFYSESNPSETVRVDVAKLSLEVVDPIIKVADNKVTVYWDKVTNASGYEVFKKVNDEDYISLGIVTDSVFSETLAVGKYSYKVVTKGNDKYADSFESKEVSVKITQQLDRVELVTNVDGKHVKLSWKPIAKASGYELYRKINNGEFELIKTINGLVDGYPIEYVDSDLANGNYSYKVLVKGDDVYLDSEYSDVISVDIEDTDDFNGIVDNDHKDESSGNQTNDSNQGKATGVKTGDVNMFKEFWLLSVSCLMISYLAIKKRFKKN